MTAADILSILAATTLTGSVALLLAFALRRPFRKVFGARAAYALWWIVPAVLLAILLPARGVPAFAPAMPSVVVDVQAGMAALPRTSGANAPAWIVALWAFGVATMLLRMALQERRFRRGLGRVRARGDGAWDSEGTAGLPAVVGVFAPRIVLPRDFEQRYGPEQRELMLAHERAHRERGDTAWNALAALLQGLFWFNPLFHFAGPRFRHDQELACDARVLAACPGSRRTYGEAMLATQLAAQPLPLGCHWGITHPLKERIEMLKRPLPNRTLRRAGLAVIAALSLGAGFAAWATQPDTKIAAAADEDFQLDAGISIDGGEAKRISIRDAYGHEFELRDETADGRSMALTGTVTPVEIEGKAAFRIATRLKVAGMQDSSPVLVAQAGAPAAIQIGDQRPDGSFHGVRIDMAITPAQRQENSAVAAVDMSRPDYPKSAAKAGIGGQVILLVDVAADGSVAGVEVQHPSQDARLDAAAVERARAWRFKPKMEDGKPVASRIRVPVTFEPTESKPQQKG